MFKSGEGASAFSPFFLGNMNKESPMQGMRLQMVCSGLRCAMLAMLLVGFQPGHALQKTGTIIGEVLDGLSSTPLVGAVITLEEGGLETVTDSNGHFMFSGQTVGSVSVRVNQSGYITRVEPVIVSIGGVSFVHFYMSSMSLLLDELRVVTDRGRRKDEGPGLGDIRPTEAESSLTVMRLLAARVPSMTVLGGNSSASGAPEIRIRGQGSMTVSNTPAIYLDGVRVTSHVLLETFAGDVERIRVLRGPSAVSMYPDAVNGVILVDSKRR